MWIIRRPSLTPTSPRPPNSVIFHPSRVFPSNKPCQRAADWTASTAFFASTLAGGVAELVAGLDGLASVVAVGTGESDAGFPDLSNGVGVAQPPRIGRAGIRVTTGRPTYRSGVP